MCTARWGQDIVFFLTVKRSTIKVQAAKQHKKRPRVGPVKIGRHLGMKEERDTEKESESQSLSGLCLCVGEGTTPNA